MSPTEAPNLMVPAAWTSQPIRGPGSISPGTTFVTSDDKTFATGFKDTLPITSGWQCNQDNNVNSKMGVAPSPVRCPDAPPDC